MKESHFIAYKDTKLHYTINGNGQTIVLLHGFLENSTMWGLLEEQLANEYQVICIDLLGHGLSGNLGNIHTMGDMADAVFAILSYLNIPTTTLIGHSMGGYVALSFAQYYPDVVKQIILITSTAQQDSLEKKTIRDRSIELVKRNAPVFIKMAIANMYDQQTKIRYSQEIEQQKQAALTTDKTGIINALLGMKQRENHELLLHTTNIPIDYILGVNDPLIPYKQTLSQAQDVGSRVESLQCGHMPQIEAPQQLTQAVLKLLK